MSLHRLIMRNNIANEDRLGWTRIASWLREHSGCLNTKLRPKERIFFCAVSKISERLKFNRQTILVQHNVICVLELSNLPKFSNWHILNTSVRLRPACVKFHHCQTCVWKRNPSCRYLESVSTKRGKARGQFRSTKPRS